ncbi:hypothetical protein BRD20_07845 [Halobacteriales archaeon SW_8_65_20]|nr:MAG: hypothetical protein BRD20_07845 [Halobacteriales archaeon SW_8_65_20]
MPDDDPDERLADALERVAHGAVVSIPSTLTQRLLTLAFTALLTNGFSAGAYGLFVLARRIQRFLRSLTRSFTTGLSRYIPNTDTDTDRDVIATFALTLAVGAATVFGTVLYLAVPEIGRLTGKGTQFELYLRVFALGLPAAVWLTFAGSLLQSLEEITPMNLTLRIGFPAFQLVAAGVGLWLGSLLAVAVGVLVVSAVGGTVALAWLARERGLRPRYRGPTASSLRRRYLRYTAPLFASSIATTVQRLGFYPLIAVFLTSTAGAVFAVGELIGVLVRLPLFGINQLMPPVAATLYGDEHHEALARLYHATSRLVLVGVTGLAVPVVVFRRAVMALFGPAFVEYAHLLPAFVLAQWIACAAGSVGILLMMTDHQRAMFLVNAAITSALVVVSIPLTRRYGLSGVVAVYLLMLSLNNTLEVVVLWRLEDLQPLTLAHLKPVAAAVPLGVVTVVGHRLVPGLAGALAATAVGLVVYAAVLLWLGFAPAERQLVGTLADRYRTVTIG